MPAKAVADGHDSTVVVYLSCRPLVGVSRRLARPWYVLSLGRRDSSRVVARRRITANNMSEAIDSLVTFSIGWWRRGL